MPRWCLPYSLPFLTLSYQRIFQNFFPWLFIRWLYTKILLDIIWRPLIWIHALTLLTESTSQISILWRHFKFQQNFSGPNFAKWRVSKLSFLDHILLYHYKSIWFCQKFMFRNKVLPQRPLQGLYHFWYEFQEIFENFLDFYQLPDFQLKVTILTFSKLKIPIGASLNR